MIIRNAVRHSQQVDLRQREILLERTRMLHNPQHCARRTMTAQPARAPIALAAGKIDLAHHSASGPTWRVCFNYFSNEFMPGNPSKTVVAALQLQVGVTNATRNQAKQRMAFGSFTFGNVADADSALFDVDGDHEGTKSLV